MLLKRALTLAGALFLTMAVAATPASAADIYEAQSSHLMGFAKKAFASDQVQDLAGVASYPASESPMKIASTTRKCFQPRTAHSRVQTPRRSLEPPG